MIICPTIELPTQPHRQWHSIVNVFHMWQLTLLKDFLVPINSAR